MQLKCGDLGAVASDPSAAESARDRSAGSRASAECGCRLEDETKPRRIAGLTNDDDDDDDEDTFLTCSLTNLEVRASQYQDLFLSWLDLDTKDGRGRVVRALVEFSPRPETVRMHAGTRNLPCSLGVEDCILGRIGQTSHPCCHIYRA